jgi:hypothetical protein
MTTQSPFSNPAGSALAEAQGYTQALLEVIGDRDPLAVMAELVPWVEQRVQSLDEAALRRPEKPGKWSVLEVLQHLADTELVYGYRVRMILTQDEPPIPGYDQDVWAQSFRYRDLPVADTLAQLRALRPANLRLYRSLDAAQRRRVGLHSERGPESVEHIMRMVGAHDLVHRRQIDRIIAALG